MADEVFGSAEARLNANRLALRVTQALLDASHGFQFTFDGAVFEVTVQRLAAARWQPEFPELSQDGAATWPAPVAIRCTWPNGAIDLVMRADRWGGMGQYRNLVGLGISVLTSRRSLLWITIPLAFRAPTDDQETVIEASFSPFKRREDAPDPSYANAHAARAVMVRAGFPFTSDYRIEACRVRLDDASILPSPEEAFERLVRLAVLKVPFFLRDGEGLEGAPPFQRESAEITDAPPLRTSAASSKRASLGALPGGVRQYKETLDALLEIISREPLPLERFYAVLRERYSVTGDAAKKGYASILTSLGFCTLSDRRLSLSSDGKAYLEKRDPDDLFERMNSVWAGILEVLVIYSVLDRTDTDLTHDVLTALLGVSWGSDNQVNFRRNWLLSLGMSERDANGDALTERGRRALERHSSEADTIRTRVEEMLDELGPDEEDEEDESADPVIDEKDKVAPGLDDERPKERAEPSAWGADRVDLRLDMVRPLVKLELPESTLASAIAALSSGKHLLLVGPPGTGKTELARDLVAAAKAEEYCRGAFVATASAEWTTFDTIGGYALQRDGSLRFRSGALLRAIEHKQWLIIDELNRADVDRCFGELMTVLSGGTTDTSFELDDGRTVRIGPDAQASHPMPKTFRVIATMNTWDKTSLFRLSYAVQRRFAIVNVGIPGDEGFATLIRSHAQQPGLDPEIDPSTCAALVDLFSSRGLLGIRPIGPAIVLDVIRYMRRRANGQVDQLAPALAEALCMLVLPQLEGLEADAATRAYTTMHTCLASRHPHAPAELRLRFTEIFPHVRLPN